MSDNQQAATTKRPPTVLFACPHSILDTTSGAAISMATLMAGLARRGMRAIALQAMIFDSAPGGEHVIKAAATKPDKQLVRTNIDGVEHMILRTKATFRGDMTSMEEERYFQYYTQELKARRPDFIITWGGMLLEKHLRRVAAEAGIPVVFYLVNPTYTRKEAFNHVSLVITDTQATADLYTERHGFTPTVLGKFIDPARIKAPKRKPENITFINPSFEKGANVFMALARRAQKELPEAKFLVVQGRGRWSLVLKTFGFKPEDFPNVKVIPRQSDMRPVYGCTRVLLLPSTWHESGARVIPEALINGIPIIASNTGGSKELLGEGGFCLDLPEVVKQKMKELAPDEAVTPWLDLLKRLIREPDFYQEACAGAERAATVHDIEKNLTRLLKAVSPVVLRSREKMAERVKARAAKKALEKKA